MTVETMPAVEVLPETSETSKPLKLSEAIRLGGMSTEQKFGEFGDTGSTCAIGAANVAYGRRPSDTELINLLKGRKAEPPCDHRGTAIASVPGVIFHLNDDDKWPREKIADWLETVGL